MKPLLLEVAIIHAVKPLNPKLATWTDFFGRTVWRFNKRNTAGAYVLARRDSDARNREPIWLGVSYYGRYHNWLRPWLDAAIMRGTDKKEALRAYAFDVGSAIFAADKPGAPSFSVGYAFGSGDKRWHDSVSQRFRQTGYEDNVDRFGGISKVGYYGSVLSPELSNLSIITVGVGCRPIGGSSMEVFYYKYRQDHPIDELPGSGLVDPPARPNGADADIGWGLDVIVASPQFLEKLRIVWTLGVFVPGFAFESKQEHAYLNRVDFNLVF